MANVGVPPVAAEFKEIPDDIYEAIITEVVEEPNRFWNPDKPNEGAKTQLVWSLKIREDGEYKGQNLRYYTGPNLGRSARNKLTNLCKAAIKDFDINVAFKDWDDFTTKMLGKPIRVTTKLTERKEGEGSYAKIDGVLPTKMGSVDSAEYLSLVMGAVDSTQGNDF